MEHDHPFTRLAIRGGTFRINARKVFATWPQCSATKEDIGEFIATKLPCRRITVARERHQDGNFHIHALVEFKKKQNITNPRIFDFEGRHANIGPVVNINACERYVRKDNDFIEINDEDDNVFNPYEKAKELPEKEFYETARKMKIPFQYANHAWELTQREANDINTITNDSRIDGSIHSEYLSNLIPEQGRTLWVKGPSGIGKTTWAFQKCEKPALLVRHLDTLRQFKIGYHKTIIFDDMNFQHIPRCGQIMLVDNYHPQQIHVRYAVVNIPAQTTKLFLSNDEIFLEDSAIARRITKINLY